MELVKLMYRYINRFINIDEILKIIKEIDLSNYKQKEQQEINDLIKDLEAIKKSTPNEIDEVEKRRLEQIDQLLEKLNPSKIRGEFDEKTKEFIKTQYQKLLEDKKHVKDGGALYEKVFTILTQNELINRYARQMDAKELLNFITEYIAVPLPPKLNQKEFDDLVHVGIKEDKREALWRLAVNYSQKEKSFTLIEDYFIKVKDSYYLAELISAVKEDLNLDELAKKVLETNDKDFINKMYRYMLNYGIFTEEELQKFKEKYQN